MITSILCARRRARPLLSCALSLSLLACSDVHSNPEPDDAGDDTLVADAGAGDARTDDGSASDGAPSDKADGGEGPTADGGDASLHPDAWIPAPTKSCGSSGGALRLPEDQAELADCTDVLGSVAITGTALTSLAGLEQLRTIAGSLTVAGNASLVDLRGPSALRSVGGDVEVRGNALLTTLQGIEQLESIEGSLTVAENDALEAISGLRGLGALGDTLRIEENPRLTSLHDVIPRAQKALIIADNAALSEADAYLFAIALLFSDATITISGNRPPSETPTRECGEPDSLHLIVDYATFAGCTHVRGSLNLADTFLPHLRALGNLRSITGNLNIFRPQKLIDLRGLEQLETIGGELLIHSTSTLETLDGPERLRSVGELGIANNFGLRSVAGLLALESVEGDLMVTGNLQLPQGDAQSFADGLTVGGEKAVGGNGP